MTVLWKLWLRLTGRYEQTRSDAIRRHPAGKKVGR